jgi:A/G-specific adenine glycosylase
MWKGLGYYARAKRLQEGAKVVVEKFNGILPYKADDLKREIPGIGPYTAGKV